MQTKLKYLNVLVDMTREDFEELKGKFIYITNDFCSKDGTFHKEKFKKYFIKKVTDALVYTISDGDEKIFTIGDIRQKTKLLSTRPVDIIGFYKWLNQNNIFKSYTNCVKANNIQALCYILIAYNSYQLMYSELKKENYIGNKSKNNKG